MSFLYLQLTHAISSLLCRINWWNQIISLKTRICHSGSKGLRSDCICICGLLWLSCDLWWWFIMPVMMVYCELWWWFIMPVTYNYACDDGLLWIVMVYCELRGVRYTWQISKKGGVLVALPSVTLGKERSCRVSRQNTRRRGHFLLSGYLLCRVYSNGHSVKVIIKSGRCALVCQVYWAWHSAKCLNFAECYGPDTL